MGLARELARLRPNTSGQLPTANIEDSAITNAKIAAMAASKLTGQVADANAPSGSVLQVVQTVKTDTYNVSNTTSYTEITGLNATITPISTSSKIFVLVHMGIACATDGAARSAAFRLYRNGSEVTAAKGNSAGNRIGSWFRVSNVADANHNSGAFASYLDSPSSTSALTYSVYVDVENGITFYLNQARGDLNDADAYGTRTISTVTLMEISG